MQPLEPFDLNLRHLRAVAIMAERGSMVAASDAVGISQPALTQGLAKLERQLAVQLFDRQPGGMVATAAGAALSARVASALAHIARSIRGASRSFAKPERLMTSTQLHAFLAVVDSLGFAGAARAVGVSQPALHRAVRDLEQVCGAALVERRGRSMMVTPAGHRLARGTRLARAELAAAIEETGPRESDGVGRITVGAMPLSRALILPRAIAAFNGAGYRSRIDIIEGSWRELIDPLRDGLLDLTIGALRDEPPEDVAQEPLLVDRLAIVGRDGHPLAGAVRRSAEELRRFSWIVGQSGTTVRQRWEELFDGHDLPDDPVECGSIMVMRELLRQTDFLALVSPDQVALELRANVLATVGPRLDRGKRTIGISHRADWRPTRNQSVFVALLRAASNRSGTPEN